MRVRRRLRTLEEEEWHQLLPKLDLLCSQYNAFLAQVYGMSALEIASHDKNALDNISNVSIFEWGEEKRTAEERTYKQKVEVWLKDLRDDRLALKKVQGRDEVIQLQEFVQQALTALEEGNVAKVKELIDKCHATVGTLTMSSTTTGISGGGEGSSECPSLTP